MIFKEYPNSEEKDYDITSSLHSFNKKVKNDGNNPYTSELIDLIGILEDVTEDDLIKQYGITMNEYLNPNSDVINKVKYFLESNNSDVKKR